MKPSDNVQDPKNPIIPGKKDPSPGVPPIHDPEPSPMPGRGPLQTIPSRNIPEGQDDNQDSPAVSV